VVVFVGVGVTAVVGEGVGVDVGGYEGFVVAVGCGGTDVGTLVCVGDGVGIGVTNLVGDGDATKVAVAKRVLVAICFGVRVGRIVAVGVREATRLGTAVPGPSIVTTTGTATGVSEGTGVTKAINIGVFRLPNASPELPGVNLNPAESCVASAKIASSSCTNFSLSLST